jgi:hypothetical protein
MSNGDVDMSRYVKGMKSAVESTLSLPGKLAEYAQNVISTVFQVYLNLGALGKPYLPFEIEDYQQVLTPEQRESTGCNKR